MTGTTTTTIVTRNNVSLIAFRGIAFTPTAITSQPSNISACVNTSATFSVTMAAGSSSSIYTYQWQQSTDAGSTWNNLTNGGNYSNVTTATVSVTAISDYNGYQYRCVVTYMGNAILNTAAATLTIPAVVTPEVTISTASTTVCNGNDVVFNASSTTGGSAPSYQWFRNGNNAGTGSSITFLAGTLTNNVVISSVLTANNLCQTSSIANSNQITLTVIPSLLIGTSTALPTLCQIGQTKTINNTNTSGGGVWSSSNTGIVTVTTVNGASGIVTAIGNGTANLTYTKTAANGCVSEYTTLAKVSSVSVNSITGNNNVCVGSSTLLSTTSTGGVWSSTNNKGSINQSGLYSGLNSGIGTVKYSITNADNCVGSAFHSISVNAIPNKPSIAYGIGTTNPQTGAGGGFCVGRTFTVVGSPVGGVWSSSNTGSMTVNSTSGFVSIVGVGSTTLTYTITTPQLCSNSRSITGNTVTCAARGINISTPTDAAENIQFKMYPNPARNSVNINVDFALTGGQIIVTNILGKQIKMQPLSLGTNNIDVSRLSKGLYLVSIITKDGKKTEKLIIE